MSGKMRRSSIDSGTSTIDHVPDLIKSNFLPSNSTLLTISNNPDDHPLAPTSSTISSPSQRFLKRWSTYEGLKFYKSITNLRLPSSGHRWKRSMWKKRRMGEPHELRSELFLNSPSETVRMETEEEQEGVSVSVSVSVSVEEIYSNLGSSSSVIDRPSSPRLSYDSSYTTIDYTESIRNSAGSELSFRCRGLRESNEDEEHEPMIRYECDEKRVESGLYYRVEDWVKLEPTGSSKA